MESIPILSYLPHRPPMQLVDAITQITDTTVTTVFQIKETCLFLERKFLTEAGLIENMAQTCSAIVGQFFFAEGKDSKEVIGYISAIKKAEIYHLPYLGQSVRTEALLLSRFDSNGYSTCAMNCFAYERELLLAQAQMNLFIKEFIR